MRMRRGHIKNFDIGQTMKQIVIIEIPKSKCFFVFSISGDKIVTSNQNH